MSSPHSKQTGNRSRHFHTKLKNWKDTITTTTEATKNSGLPDRILLLHTSHPLSCSSYKSSNNISVVISDIDLP